MMESKICVNVCCGVKTTVQWKKGWLTKSRLPADLCFNCGSAYDNSVYCETFHGEETGWRECSLCNKRLHCGCSASLPFLEIQDFGGVLCIRCAQSAGTRSHSVLRHGISCVDQTPIKDSNTNDLQNSQPIRKLDFISSMGKGNMFTLGNVIENTVPSYSPQPRIDTTDAICGQPKPESKTSVMPAGLGFPDLSNVLNGSGVYAQPSEDKNNVDVNKIRGPQIPSLDRSLQSPVETSNFTPRVFNGIEEDKSRSSDSQPGRPRQIFPKPPKVNPAKGCDSTKSPFSPMRVARPPAEGRLRNQLLPRYWPRITDQELQKLSGDLNSTVVPLFEKILSASDASRIGRLVLPKACAEAYFPSINQSEGLPIKMRDVNGNEWTFQFRFWPNNNSRMYVLEGVTPCIQAMQLQAGDTVTFSRIDPGGKLVIGFRKASNTFDVQDAQTSSANSVCPPSGESFHLDMTDGLATGSVPLEVQPTKEAQDEHLNVLPKHSQLVNGETVLSKCENLSMETETALQQPKLTPEKKRTRNFSSKCKRLIMHDEDVVELRLSWEETQGLLRPPPSLKPNIVMVEDIEFEEYSEPPVFGKRTYFTSRVSGALDQWAQCDKCSKWRKLPGNVLLQPQWTCLENVWDLNRSSCDTPEEMSSKELEAVFRVTKDLKNGKIANSPGLGQGCQPSGLDALATAATLSDHAEPSAEPTTRHPRHRPGCSCIVCIQPPSGKGKHKASCVCNVCLTVKRRFKTLMMRKKKRQGEREAELALQKKSSDRPIKKPRVKKASTDDSILDKDLESDECDSKGHIDLNCHPIREKDAKVAEYGDKVQVNADDKAQVNAEISRSRSELPPLDLWNTMVKEIKQQKANDGFLSSKDVCHTSTNMQDKDGDDQGSKKCS